jgi:hypothetical protein
MPDNDRIQVIVEAQYIQVGDMIGGNIVIKVDFDGQVVFVGYGNNKYDYFSPHQQIRVWRKQ